MPTVKIIPAIPGKVKVASKILRSIKRKRFIIKAVFVIKPRILYLIRMNIITNKKQLSELLYLH